jgi:hypothetical protein
MAREERIDVIETVRSREHIDRFFNVFRNCLFVETYQRYYLIISSYMHNENATFLLCILQHPTASDAFASVPYMQKERPPHGLVTSILFLVGIRFTLIS